MQYNSLTDHKSVFTFIYSAAVLAIKDNRKLYQKQILDFRRIIEDPLLNKAKQILTRVFDQESIDKLDIDFTFCTFAPKGNSGGADFLTFDGSLPEVKIVLNFNNNIRTLYKKSLWDFSLILTDVFFHEILHVIQYIKVYKKLGDNLDNSKGNILTIIESKLLAKDTRLAYKQYNNDILYFSSYEEIQCYAKDAARQLLSAYKNKNTVFNKLSISSELLDLVKTSDCFYYYYDCFYELKSKIWQYDIIWKAFIKHLYYYIFQDFTI